MEKNVRFNSIITNVEKINPLFSRASIRALYVGANRNGSFISKEATEKAIKTIYNVPIVGEYIEQNDNFGGHGGEVVIKGDDITFKSTTMPYGVIPESATIKWEMIEEKNGTTNEYLVIDGAYLWTGRYEELNILLEKNFGQSMEIEVQNGSFAVVDGVETFKIDDFIFSAFCILGIDRDGEGHVEPAFESAGITTYSLDKENFKKQFNQMIAELKFSLMQEGGKDNMPTENEKVVKDYEKTEVETDTTETTEEVEIVETQIVDETVADVNPDNPDNSTEAPESFEEDSLTDDTETTESNEINSETDVEETQVEDEPEVDYEAKFNELSTQHTALEIDFTSLQSQLSELQTYKRQREESDLKAKFEGKLSDEEFNQVFTELNEEPLEKVEEKLFSLIGKKNFSIQPTQKNNVNKVTILSPKEEVNNPYGGIFD